MCMYMFDICIYISATSCGTAAIATAWPHGLLAVAAPSERAKKAHAEVAGPQRGNRKRGGRTKGYL